MDVGEGVLPINRKTSQARLMAKIIGSKKLITIDEFLAVDGRAAKRFGWLGDLVSFVQLLVGDVLRIACKSSEGKVIKDGSLEIREVESDTLKVKDSDGTEKSAVWEEVFMELTRDGATYRVWVPWSQLTSSVLVRDGFSTEDVRDIRRAASGRGRRGMVNAIYASEFEVNDGKAVVDAFRNGCTVDKVFESKTSKKRGYRWVKPKRWSRRRPRRRYMPG